jgi:hypothetical protein
LREFKNDALFGIVEIAVTCIFCSLV